MAKEIDFLTRLLGDVDRPYVAVLGGAKVSDKIAVIDNLLTKVDLLVLGGGMANTFLLATGKKIGSSLVEADRKDEAARIMKEIERDKKRLLLPVDVLCAPSVDEAGAERAAG
jgi:phosphoglycerate kinase